MVIDMLHIKSLEEGLDIFKALGSEVRIGIIKNLSENRGMNMNELAAKLNITNGALTGHIKKLEDCGLVTVSNESGGHGNEKKCSVCLDKILIEMDTQEDYKKFDAKNEYTEGIAETLRTIKSVEISAVLKENDNGDTKVSLRSDNVDVCEIVKRFNGGGHIHAAGCTIRKPLKIATELLVDEIEKCLNS